MLVSPDLSPLRLRVGVGLLPRDRPDSRSMWPAGAVHRESCWPRSQVAGAQDTEAGGATVFSTIRGTPALISEPYPPPFYLAGSGCCCRPGFLSTYMDCCP